MNHYAWCSDRIYFIPWLHGNVYLSKDAFMNLKIYLLNDGFIMIFFLFKREKIFVEGKRLVNLSRILWPLTRIKLPSPNKNLTCSQRDISEPYLIFINFASYTHTTSKYSKNQKYVKGRKRYLLTIIYAC